jgi:hypothetical protein
MAVDVVQVVKHLPSRGEVLSSNPSTSPTKKKKKKEWNGFIDNGMEKILRYHAK